MLNLHPDQHSGQSDPTANRPRTSRKAGWTVRISPDVDLAAIPLPHFKMAAVLERLLRTHAHCFPSNATLATRYGCSERQARGIIREMEEAGFITRVYRDPARPQLGRSGILANRRLDLDLPVAERPPSGDDIERLKIAPSTDLRNAPMEENFRDPRKKTSAPPPEENFRMKNDSGDLKEDEINDDNSGVVVDILSLLSEEALSLGICGYRPSTHAQTHEEVTVEGNFAFDGAPTDGDMDLGLSPEAVAAVVMGDEEAERRRVAALLDEIEAEWDQEERAEKGKIAKDGPGPVPDDLDPEFAELIDLAVAQFPEEPGIAAKVKSACQRYTAAWVELALGEARHQKAESWHFMTTVLGRWSLGCEGPSLSRKHIQERRKAKEAAWKARAEAAKAQAEAEAKAAAEAAKAAERAAIEAIPPAERERQAGEALVQYRAAGWDLRRDEQAGRYERVQTTTSRILPPQEVRDVMNRFRPEVDAILDRERAAPAYRRPVAWEEQPPAVRWLGNVIAQGLRVEVRDDGSLQILNPNWAERPWMRVIISNLRKELVPLEAAVKALLT